MSTLIFQLCDMLILKILLFIHCSRWVSSTISGLTYMDSLKQKPLKETPRGEDPCKPLYWYPRNIPDYCYKTIDKSVPKTTSVPLPPQPIHIPVSLPIPLPPSVAPLQMHPFPPMYSTPFLPMPQMYQVPPLPLPPMHPVAPMHSVIPGASMPAIPHPPPPLPFGIPLAPSNPMLPTAGIPTFSYQPSPFRIPTQQIGMVPGIPGLVTRNGGINILPFSDVYADMLDKHKRRVVRKKINRILDDYYPRRRKNRY